jgi:carboxypeptidase Q
MKYISMFFFLSIFALLPLFAQEQIDTAAVMKIKDEGINHSQVMEIESWIADICGPRLNWSPEFREAADWASAKLKEIGAEKVHYENFGPAAKGWTLKKFYLNAIEPHAFPLIAYPKAWSPGTKGIITGKAVYLDAQNDADLEKFHGKLKGAFVLLNDLIPVAPHFQGDASREPDSTLLKLANLSSADRGRRGRRPQMDSTFMKRMIFNLKKMEFCQKEGAAVLIEGNRGDDGTLQNVAAASVPRRSQDTSNVFGMRLNAYDADAPQILPQLTVAAEHYNRMLRTIQKGKNVTLEMKLDVEFTKPDSSFNIIAEIPGTDLKDEIVMIGGHFDSWHAATGATDNGSGVAVCMEAIRILKTLGLQPRRTIRIGLWGGEEEGLLGSHAYVKQHFAERLEDTGYMSGGGSGSLTIKPEFEKFDVYFNNDNGGGKVRGLYMQGNETVRSIFRSWLSVYGDPAAQTLTIASTGGTDHLSFDGVGLPGFQFIQDMIDYMMRTHHTNMDVVERIVEDDLKQSATIMAVFAYNAAMRDSLFPRKQTPSPASR